MGDSLKNKTAQGLFWGGVSNIIQQILGLFFGIFLARKLNADDYGLVGMLTIFSTLAGSFISSGFTVALTKKKDVTEADYNAVFWFMFFMSIFFYLVLFFLSPLIASFYNRQELLNLSRVVFISFLLAGFSGVSYTVMYKKIMVKEQAQIEIFSMLSSGLIGIYLALNDYSYWSLAIQSLVFIGLSSILRFIVSPWKPSFKFSFQPLKEFFSFSVKMLMTNVVNQLSNNIFSLLLGKFYNARLLGYYSQGQKWEGMGHQLIVGMMNSVSLPVLVEVVSDKERQLRVLRKLICFGAFVSFPFFAILSFAAGEFISITIGDKWLNSVVYLRMFCIWGAVAFLWNIYTNVLTSYGKSDLILIGHLLMSSIQIGLLLVLFKYGIIIMLSAYILSFYFGISFWHYHVSLITKIRISHLFKDLLPYLFSVIVSIIIAYIISLNVENIYLRFIVKVLVSLLIYILILWMNNTNTLKESIKFILNHKF